MCRRASILLLLVALTACAGDPRALGITGPGHQPAQAETPSGLYPGDSTGDESLTGERYAPSMIPTTSGGRYWGYN
jgi:hypothetical protein